MILNWFGRSEANEFARQLAQFIAPGAGPQRGH